MRFFFENFPFLAGLSVSWREGLVRAGRNLSVDLSGSGGDRELCGQFGKFPSAAWGGGHGSRNGSGISWSEALQGAELQKGTFGRLLEGFRSEDKDSWRWI